MRTPFVVLGAAGGGKSAAVAKWLLQHTRTGFVFVHFIGSTANSTDHLPLVRRILIELQRAFRLEGEVPSEPAKALELLPLWLERACAIGPVVLLIDGLDQVCNPAPRASSFFARLLTPHVASRLGGAPPRCRPLHQLNDTDGEASSLRWLPTYVPLNCTLVLTITAGTPAAKACERSGREAWKRVTLEKLAEADKEAAIKAYLSLVRKTFEQEIMIMIIQSPHTSNPLYLRLLLDELLTTAVFETVTTITRHLLTAKSPIALADIVLNRYETNFGVDLVQRTYAAANQTHPSAAFATPDCTPACPPLLRYPFFATPACPPLLPPTHVDNYGSRSCSHLMHLLRTQFFVHQGVALWDVRGGAPAPARRTA